MDLTLKTPATKTSISVDLVKAGKRIRHGSEDDLIEFWIRAADEYVEKRTNLSLMEQTYVLRLRRILPSVQLPRPPLKSITSVKYAVTGGTEQVLSDPDDRVRIDRMLPTIDTGLVEHAGTMEIEYVVGADDPEKVPAALRQASYLLAASWVESRAATYQEPRIMQVEKKISFGVDQLTKELRVPNGTDLNGGW
jgi:uncharacterized phiE125 gp8 family phage protein